MNLQRIYCLIYCFIICMAAGFAKEIVIKNSFELIDSNDSEATFIQW